MAGSQGPQIDDDDKFLRSCTKKIGQTIYEGAERIRFKSCSSFPTIHKVPDDLRQLKESAYTPRLVSIGPLHREDQRLKHSHDIKLFYADFLFGQVDNDPEKKFPLLKECLAEMIKYKDEAKKFYADADRAKGLDAEMLLIDGCFILGLLYKSYCKYKSQAAPRTKLNELPSNSNSNSNHQTEPVFCSSLTLAYVQHDLLLLENQLPFPVLDNLFERTMARIPNSDPNLSLSNYVLLFFHNIMSFGPSSEPRQRSEKVFHILHLLHGHYRPQSPADQPQSPADQPQSSADIENPNMSDQSGMKSEKVSYSDILRALEKKDEHFEYRPCASDLDFAGVKFVRCSGPDPFEIKFSKAKGALKWFRRDLFKIPKLRIDDSTEPVLRNLIALELCCVGVSQHFTSYAHLMDRLINTDNDVRVLEKAKLIDNCLGADEVAADLFNKLCKEVVIGRSDFEQGYELAAEYSKRWWPKTMAYVRRTYFAGPWTFIAFCVAFIAFGMSITQFIRSFK